MELKEFIKNALSDIVLSIKESQSDLRLPGIGIAYQKENSGYIVNFDIAISIEDNSSVNGGVGGSIKIFEGKVGGSIENKNQNISRISFGIEIGDKI